MVSEKQPVRMPVRDPSNMLMTVGIAAVALMVFVTAKGFGGLILAPGVLFTVLLVSAALFVNAADWIAPTGPDAQRRQAALARNARLLGTAYGFSAIAMMALYATRFTGLRWQHGWQYASAFALLAGLSFEYGRLTAQSSATGRTWLAQLAVPLAIVQATLATGGLAFLALSGKVLTRRPDWAANLIFLFAAVMVMMLCAIALRTHARLGGP